MIIIAFGDSLTDPDTYESVADEPWSIQIEDAIFAHEIGLNLATGGAVSGWKRHINGNELYDWVYQLDGVTLEALGMLGQINVYKQGSLFDIIQHRHDVVHVLWAGINDLVIASMLDPFTNSEGVTVDSTEIVKSDREWYFQTHPNASEHDYAQSVIDDYTVKNIEAGIAQFENFGETVVVGPFDLGETELARQRNRTRISSDNSHYLDEKLQAAVDNAGGRYVSLIDLEVTTIDEIHLDHAAQREVMERIVTVK